MAVPLLFAVHPSGRSLVALSRCRVKEYQSARTTIPSLRANMRNSAASGSGIPS
jgi:hypothetical protein